MCGDESGVSYENSPEAEKIMQEFMIPMMYNIVGSTPGHQGHDFFNPQTDDRMSAREYYNQEAINKHLFGQYGKPKKWDKQYGEGWTPEGYSDISEYARQQGNYPADPSGMWNIPEYPKAPYTPPDYDIPNMPTFGDLDKQTRDALWQPYQEAGNMFKETLSGSPGAGYGMSSASGGMYGLGDLFLKGATAVQKDAYGMQMPGWGAQLDQNIQGWQGRNQQGMMDYQGAQNMWGSQLEQNMYPYSAILGTMPQVMPQGYMNPSTKSSGSDWLGTVGSLGLAAASIWSSDRRLKTDIMYI